MDNKKYLALILVLVWVGVGVFSFESYYHYDWNRGVERTVITFFVLMWLLVLGIFGKYLVLPAKRLINVMGAIVLGGVLTYHLLIGFESILETQKTNFIPMDQGQIIYRSIVLVQNKINPYASHMILDPVTYIRTLEHNPEYKQCFEHGSEKMKEEVWKYWETLDGTTMERLMPDYSDPSCIVLQNDFEMMGNKYGPALTLAYYPFVLVLGKSGIFAAHLVGLVLLVYVLGLLYKLSGAQNVLVFVLGTLIVFLPHHLRLNILEMAASDLIPTVTALGSLYLFFRRKDMAAGVLLALSISSKVFPGLFLVPILILRHRKTMPSLVLMTAVINLPFFVLDPVGYWANIVKFNFARIPDSTSLAYYISQRQHALLSISVFLVLACVYYKYVVAAKKNEQRAVLFILFSMLAAFVTSKSFHNNYLIWILPFVGVYFFYLFSRRSE